MSYKYIHWGNGIIVLQANNGIEQVELNRLSRYLFGKGASLDKVFNCGGGAFIKFQSQPVDNKRRAFLLTKVYRWCKKNNIKINGAYFPPKQLGAREREDFTEITTIIKIHQFL